MLVIDAIRRQDSSTASTSVRSRVSVAVSHDLAPLLIELYGFLRDQRGTRPRGRRVREGRTPRLRRGSATAALTLTRGPPARPRGDHRTDRPGDAGVSVAQRTIGLSPGSGTTSVRFANRGGDGAGRPRWLRRGCCVGRPHLLVGAGAAGEPDRGQHVGCELPQLAPTCSSPTSGSSRTTDPGVL